MSDNNTGRRAAVVAVAAAVLVTGVAGAAGVVLRTQAGPATSAVTAGAQAGRAGDAAIGSAPAVSALGGQGASSSLRPAPGRPPAGGTPVKPADRRPVEPTDRRPVIPSAVPARAFLHESDVPGRSMGAPDRLDGADLPSFCGATFDQPAKVGIRATQGLLYTGADAPEHSTPESAVVQDIIVYRTDGAKRFMAGLRTAVRNCPTETISGVQVRNVSHGTLGRGDDSVLIERNRPATGDDGEPTGDGTLRRTFWSAVRVGDTITLVANNGWESASPTRTDSAHLGRRAAARLDAWR